MNIKNVIKRSICAVAAFAMIICTASCVSGGNGSRIPNDISGTDGGSVTEKPKEENDLSAVSDALNRGSVGRGADWHSCFVWMGLSIAG